MVNKIFREVFQYQFKILIETLRPFISFIPYFLTGNSRKVVLQKRYLCKENVFLRNGE